MGFSSGGMALDGPWQGRITYIASGEVGMRWMVAAGGLALLGACAVPGPTAEAPCYFPGNSYMADDEHPISRIVMLNTGRTCGISFRRDNTVSRSGTIITQPAHGKARVVRTAAGTVAAYLPDKSFTGEDSFRAAMGVGGQVMTIDVTVRAPAPP